MAPSRELRGKRAVTGLPYTFKKRVIPQDDDLDSLGLDRLRTAPLPAKPARLPAGQQSLLLSPPRFSTLSDNVSAQVNVDFADLKESVPIDHDEIGRLVTVFGQNQHVIRIRPRERQFTIGRHRSADFVLPSQAVSNIHGKVFAHTCDTGDTLVCYEDVSRAGTIYNDEILLNKEAVILSHGDTLSIDSCEFFYFHFAEGGTISGRTEYDFWHPFPRNIDEYRVTSRTLGSGSYAVVHLAHSLETGRQSACKVMKKRMIATRNLYDKVELEIRTLTESKHPNLLGFVDACSDGEHWYLMLDLCVGGDLHSYVVRKEKLGGSETLFITYQLLLALDYMHNTTKAAHRDIKPENVLLRNRGPYPHVVISDFGTITFDASKPSMAFLGTLDYWSPECFTGSYIPSMLDCFSLGCTLYVMLSGLQPFRRWGVEEEAWLRSSGDERAEEQLRPDLQKRLTAHEKQVAKAILRCSPPYHQDLGHIDRDGIDFVRALLAPAPKYRLTVRTAFKHAWLSKNASELEKLYSRNVRPLRQD